MELILVRPRIRARRAQGLALLVLEPLPLLVVDSEKRHTSTQCGFLWRGNFPPQETTAGAKVMIMMPLLREGVEEIVGMDGHFFLFDTFSGVYHRLDPVTAFVVRKFDGKTNSQQIADLVNLEHPNQLPLSAIQVENLVEKLHQKSLLSGDTPQKPRRLGINRLLPRFLLFTKFAILLNPIVNFLKRFYNVYTISIGVFLSLCGYVFGAFTLFHWGSFSIVEPSTQLFFAMLLALVLHFFGVFLHEIWHGIVTGIHGQPARGLGIALMFWVIPVFYVDRTDAYRLHKKSNRVAIALAGMVSDGWVMGVTAFVVVWTQGLAHTTAIVLLSYQIFLLFANLNPLAPSDTVSALEAGLGSVDLRGRSMSILRAVFLRKPLPGYLQNLSTRRKALLLVYGVLSLLFAVWVFFVAFYILWNSLSQGMSYAR